MSLELRIKQLLKEGKSRDQIFEIVAKEFEGTENESILKAYESALKAIELETMANKKIADEEARKAIDAKVDKLLEEKLKSIKIDALGNLGQKKMVKFFNSATGKIEERDHDAQESVKMFQNMLMAGIRQDGATMKSISDEIDQHNKSFYGNIAEAAGKATNDPVTSTGTTGGGYAVPAEVDSMIHQVLYTESVMLKNANIQNVIYNTKLYPLMYGISVVEVADQATAVTESQASFTNPTITMQRLGGYTNIANELILMGIDITAALAAAYGAAFAYKLDYLAIAGNVTGVSNLQDGIVFDTLTSALATVAASSFALSNLKTLKNTLTYKIGKENVVFMASRVGSDLVGLLEDTSGRGFFPQYLVGGNVNPFGIPLIQNWAIPSTFAVGSDNLGSSQDVIVCYDKSKFVMGVGPTRIDYSTHWRFTTDVTTIRAIQRSGWKVLSGTSTGGIVAAVLPISN